MSLSIEVRYAGESHSLTDGTYCVLGSIDSYAMPPVRRFEERGPQQHGITDVGYRLDARVITMTLWIYGDSLEDVDGKREAILSWFSPANGDIALRLTLADGSVREIVGNLQAGLAGAMAAGRGFAETLTLQFRCADPVFYDPVVDGIQSNLGGGTNAGSIPMAVPMSVGTDVVDWSGSVIYPGTWLTYPVIRLYGPITDWIIRNDSTDEELDGTGDTIADGDWYEFDCRYGYKTVKNQGGANKLATLSADSDLATFHIAPAPEVAGGINAFSVSGSGAGVHTRIIITYYVRYLGI